MIPNKTVKKITVLQWIVIALFALALTEEIVTFLNPISWVIKNKQVLNLQYFYLFLPILFNPLGLYGLYKVTKFDKKGFNYFYISFFSSMFLDFLRGTSFAASLITVFGNLLLFLLFYFTTKKIYTASS